MLNKMKMQKLSVLILNKTISVPICVLMMCFTIDNFICIVFQTIGKKIMSTWPKRRCSSVQLYYIDTEVRPLPICAEVFAAIVLKKVAFHGQVTVSSRMTCTFQFVS